MIILVWTKDKTYIFPTEYYEHIPLIQQQLCITQSHLQ